MILNVSGVTMTETEALILTNQTHIMSAMAILIMGKSSQFCDTLFNQSTITYNYLKENYLDSLANIDQHDNSKS